MAQWNREQLILAFEFFHGCPEATQTDAHPTCARIAAEISGAGPLRSAGAVDKILRNIKQAGHGSAGLPHASKLIQELASQFADPENRAILNLEAAEIRTRWGLPSLVC